MSEGGVKIISRPYGTSNYTDSDLFLKNANFEKKMKICKKSFLKKIWYIFWISAKAGLYSCSVFENQICEIFRWPEMLKTDGTPRFPIISDVAILAIFPIVYRKRNLRISTFWPKFRFFEPKFWSFCSQYG